VGENVTPVHRRTFVVNIPMQLSRRYVASYIFLIVPRRFTTLED
jgi:hypothetical protein